MFVVSGQILILRSIRTAAALDKYFTFLQERAERRRREQVGHQLSTIDISRSCWLAVLLAVSGAGETGKGGAAKSCCSLDAAGGDCQALQSTKGGIMYPS